MTANVLTRMADLLDEDIRLLEAARDALSNPAVYPNGDNLCVLLGRIRDDIEIVSQGITESTPDMTKCTTEPCQSVL